MTREEFDELRANGEIECPDCGERSTHPRGGCSCPPSDTGYGTKHINEYHHTCELKKIGDKRIMLTDLEEWFKNHRFARV